MEAAILAAEEAVAARQAAVERAATAGHAALADGLPGAGGGPARGREAVRPLAGAGGEAGVVSATPRWTHSYDPLVNNNVSA